MGERPVFFHAAQRHLDRVADGVVGRDRELQESFVALPTFEDESRVTVRRLAEFATDTNPLVSQLRPAARELSPTLIDLSALAPDLKRLFIELNRLGTSVVIATHDLGLMDQFESARRLVLGEGRLHIYD